MALSWYNHSFARYIKHCMEVRYKPVAVWVVLSPHLEDRIRDLCTRAVSSDDADLSAVMAELRAALQEHVNKIRTLAVRQLAREGPSGDET
jgi:hypothetical protein